MLTEATIDNVIFINKTFKKLLTAATNRKVSLKKFTTDVERLRAFS